MLRDAAISEDPSSIGRAYTGQREEESAKRNLHGTKQEAEIGAPCTSSSVEKAIADGLASLNVNTSTALVVRNARFEESTDPSMTIDNPEAKTQGVLGSSSHASSGHPPLEDAQGGGRPTDLALELEQDNVKTEASAHDLSIVSNLAVVSGSVSTPARRANLTDLSPVDGTQRVREWLSAQGKVKPTTFLDKAGYVRISADTLRTKSPPLNQSPTRRPRSSTLRSKKAAEGNWYPFVDHDTVLRKSSSQKGSSLSSSSSIQPLYQPITSGEALSSSAPRLTPRPDENVMNPPPLRLPSPNRALSSTTSTIYEGPISNDENSDPRLTTSYLRGNRRSVSPERPSARRPLAEKIVPILVNIKLDKPIEWQGTPAPDPKQRAGTRSRSPIKYSDARTGLVLPSWDPNQTTSKKISSETLPQRAKSAAQRSKGSVLHELEHSAAGRGVRALEVADRSTHSRPPVAALKLSLGLTNSLKKDLDPGSEILKSASLTGEISNSLKAPVTDPRSNRSPAPERPSDPFAWLLPSRHQASKILTSDRKPSSTKTGHPSPEKGAVALAQAFDPDEEEISPENHLQFDEVAVGEPPNRAIANVSPFPYRWPIPGRTLASEILDAGETLSVFGEGSDSPGKGHLAAESDSRGVLVGVNDSGEYGVLENVVLRDGRDGRIGEVGKWLEFKNDG